MAEAVDDLQAIKERQPFLSLSERGEGDRREL
jgi:hypothetical protein